LLRPVHLIPVMSAHEMGFFYDEGLKTEDGLPAYTILRQAMAPFGLEKMGISQAMKEQSVDIALDVQSRTVFFQRARGADLYIISGWRNQHTNVWVGDMLAEEEKLGELNYDVSPINDVSAQDLVAQAYKELMERQELKEEYGRVAAIAQKWGY
jgi:hypothetical protein